MTASPILDPQEKANILVVDDLPEKHVVFRTILDELGQNIVSARSGQEALKYILEMEFAVILLDVNMPDIDGLETASLIRQYKKSAQTPIVFITAYVDELQRPVFDLGEVFGDRQCRQGSRRAIERNQNRSHECSSTSVTGRSTALGSRFLLMSWTTPITSSWWSRMGTVRIDLVR